MVSLETTPSLQLPVIDFTSQDLKPGTVEWDSVRGDVRIALEEYGCFEALFDKVPLKLRNAVFDASEEFSQLPLDAKKRIVSEKKPIGYVGQDPSNPLYDGVGIEFSDDPEKVKAFTQKLWPKGNISFSKTVLSYTEQVSKLDLMTRRMIMESFGIDDEYINKHLNSTKIHLAMMRYDGVEATKEESGMEAHTDRSVLAIVCQSKVEDGIEVKTKDDKHWNKANASQESSFIVIAGAMLHSLLNGRVSAALHRVMRKGTNTRYASGLFSVHKTGELVYAPEEMVDAEHPRLFKPFYYDKFFQFTTEGPGRRDLSALRTYCGI